MEKLTDQEKFDIEVWYVLDKIVKTLRYHIEQNNLQYNIFILHNLLQKDMPFLIKEAKILQWLEKNKAIKLNYDAPFNTNPVIIELPSVKEIKMHTLYHINIINPCFDRLYEEYKNKSKIRMDKLIKQKGQISKKQLKLLADEIIKTKNFGAKETKFFLALLDLKPHSIKELTTLTKAKAIEHVKERVKEKLKNTRFKIKTKKAHGLEKDSFYQLEFLL